MPKKDLQKNIEQFFEKQIRPVIQLDGGDIHFLGVKKVGDGYSVKVSLDGACVGCGLSEITLKMGVETRLKDKFEEVKEIEVV